MRTAPDILDTLRSGELRLTGLLPRASNYTFLGEVSADGGSLPVVYKPREGETPLWDFPQGTLCQREVAAYVVASALGWPNVPPTVLRDGPHGEGSVQLFVDAEAGEHYYTLRERRPGDFRAVAAFDMVVGNGDRKSGHCLLGIDGQIWVIDHGLCFNDRAALRTVIWEFAGEPVPPDLLDDIRGLHRDLREGNLTARLLGLLSAAELDAMVLRAQELIAAERFPSPGPGRSQPWPAV
ncbi:MAG: SCO1664 family protein [Actinomycetota bacterium]|nr:SCO1664 family protein [Actinomycetota bacterium]